VPNPSAWAHLALRLLGGTGKKGGGKLPRRIEKPLILVRSDEEALEDTADALRALAPVLGLPEPETAFFGEDPSERLASMERLHNGAAIVLITPDALEVPAPSSEEHASRRLAVRPGGGLGRKALLDRLSALGYLKADFVESPGEYAARGAVVDFFPLEPLEAVRVLFDGEVIISLRAFDPQTQESLAKSLESAVVVPSRERNHPRNLGEVLSQRGTWVAEEGVRVPDGVVSYVAGPGSTGNLNLGSALGFKGPDPAGSGAGGIDAAARLCSEWAKSGLRVWLFSMNRGEDERLRELLEDRIPAGCVQFLIGRLRQGFVNKEAGIACVSSAEIFGRSYRQSRLLKPVISGRVRVRWNELKKGDFVVHEQYGISRFLGLEPVSTTGGTPRGDEGDRGVMDCLKLEFRGGDVLFVPMTEFRNVQKYIGSEGHQPRLSSLDTKTWGEVKERVQESVRAMAKGLLKTHAARKALPGYAFEPASPMEREFAESFPFEETPDQRRAIEEVTADMEAPHPMDRIVVGDVGFGKTEVAMRAALKCAAGLRQTGVLVPTTILADQHTRTFRKRFAEYPVRIEMLSRFQTKAEQKKILQETAEGKVEVLIGTHRLLQKDLRFKDLGLLIIDEEHRFGVKHKETLKAMRSQVDCLSLSATPIPRTLHQGMSGLRDISLIQTAPSGRQATLTDVRPFDEEHVKAAVEAELSRGGQVFFVHNRVRTLPQAEKRLRDLLPGARIAMAHGQMRSERLEKTMWEFFSREYDVLVASTIIESGLDIPSVNTLLIEDAQDFGLSQLYQLRGRIGRERTKAYCYLYYPAGRKDYAALSADARKRLDALREFGELGAGLALAMRDLEIRGAGDLLGAKQHGFLNAVGVEFYSELLDSEVQRLQGKAPRTAPQKPAHLDIEIPAFIPGDILPGDIERLRFYKRLLSAGAGGEDTLDGLRRELEDLSGPLPGPVEGLFRILRIRTRATRAGVRSLVQRGPRVEIYFHPETAVPVEAVTRWMSVYKEKIEFVRSEEGDGLRVRLDRRDPLQWSADFLEGLVR